MPANPRSVARDAENRGPQPTRKLDGDRSHPAGGSRNGDDLAVLQPDGLYGGRGGGARHIQGARRLPRHFRGLGHHLVGGQAHGLRLARPFITPTDHLIADCNTYDALSHLAHHASEVAALPGRKGSRPALVEEALADRRLARVDSRSHHVHHDSIGPSSGTGDVYHLQHIDIPVLVEPNRSHRSTSHTPANSGVYLDIPPSSTGPRLKDLWEEMGRTTCNGPC